MRRAVLILVLLLAFPVGVCARSASPHALLLKRLNAIRAAHGLTPLRLRASLDRVALGHTRYLARIGMLTHDSADGTHAPARIRRVYRARLVGETLAFGTSVAWIVNAWMHSPAHRDVLLDPSFRWIGIGSVRAADGTLWATADLGS